MSGLHKIPDKTATKKYAPAAAKRDTQPEDDAGEVTDAQLVEVEA